ncbi:MAG: 2-acyl-glycerophospho-ethanolamine acyltransferase, partial [Verrucomicrobiota bacterium]
MSSSSNPILHKDRIPTTGVLVIPGRLNHEQLLLLEKTFHGRKITWLVEEDSQHDPALRGYLEKSESGAMFSAKDAAPDVAGNQMKHYLADGGVLIFVPGRSTVRNATACHIPSAHLRA